MRFLIDESLQRHVADLLVDNGQALRRGAVITVETRRIRVRELPIKP